MNKSRKFKGRICCGGHLDVTYGGELLYLRIFSSLSPPNNFVKRVLPFPHGIIITHANRGFPFDVISSQFFKSSYSRPPCWFPFAWPVIGKYNKTSRYFLFSSYHNTKLRPSDKNLKTHTVEISNLVRK